MKYRYTITAYDEAGNAKVKVVLAEPGQSVAEGVPSKPSKPSAKSSPSRATLLGPADGAHLALPPQLTWRPVSGATYYNVQLFRNGQKILSTWPSTTSLGLKRSWTYAGHRYALTRGRYRWYVWPGFGSRSANRYGKLIGSRSFVVTG